MDIRRTIEEEIRADEAKDGNAIATETHQRVALDRGENEKREGGQEEGDENDVSTVEDEFESER